MRLGLSPLHSNQFRTDCSYPLAPFLSTRRFHVWAGDNWVRYPTHTTAVHDACTSFHPCSMYDRKLLWKAPKRREVSQTENLFKLKKYLDAKIQLFPHTPRTSRFFYASCYRVALHWLPRSTFPKEVKTYRLWSSAMYICMKMKYRISGGAGVFCVCTLCRVIVLRDPPSMFKGSTLEALQSGRSNHLQAIHAHTLGASTAVEGGVAENPCNTRGVGGGEGDVGTFSGRKKHARSYLALLSKVGSRTRRTHTHRRERDVGVFW